MAAEVGRGARSKAPNHHVPRRRSCGNFGLGARASDRKVEGLDGQIDDLLRRRCNGDHDALLVRTERLEGLQLRREQAGGHEVAGPRRQPGADDVRDAREVDEPDPGAAGPSTSR